MFFCFDPRALDVTLSPARTVEVASAQGFAGVSFDGEAVAGLEPAQREALKADLQEKSLVVGPWSLPFDWRGSEADFKSGLKDFEPVVEAMAEFGPSTVTTWIAPFSNEFEWNDNLKVHVKRLRAIAERLQSVGQGFSLALEFLGTCTLRRGFRYEFVHNLRDLYSLCQRVAAHCVGLVFDAWSVYASGKGVTDWDTLMDGNVLSVQIGDAPTDVPTGALDETERLLPGEGGAIDSAALLRRFSERGYEGPLIVEACAGAISALAPEKRAEAAVKTLWATVAGTPDPVSR